MYRWLTDKHHDVRVEYSLNTGEVKSADRLPHYIRANLAECAVEFGFNRNMATDGNLQCFYCAFHLAHSRMLVLESWKYAE